MAKPNFNNLRYDGGQVSKNFGNYARYNNTIQEYRKRSGCRKGTSPKTGRDWVSGWNVSSQGYMTFLAFPYKGTKNRVSKNGKEWENWVARITFPDKRTQIVPVLCEVATLRILFKDINMIANPRASNGGYWGRMVRNKR